VWVPGSSVRGMTLTPAMVTFDTLDARALSAWWAEQTGGEVRDIADGWFVMVTPGPMGGPVLGFQKVEDPTPGKNRVHLDFGGSAGREAEAERLLAAGASLVGRHEHDGYAWVVLADPDGNQFCVGDGA
jgi:predicted enzyme related to lactoylglutathione lyase